jgi:hypothetical protein
MTGGGTTNTNASLRSASAARMSFSMAASVRPVFARSAKGLKVT